jgi:hypothetical protein
MPNKSEPAASKSSHLSKERPKARHDPSAFLPDFDEDQRACWDELVRSFFQSSIDGLSEIVRNAGGDARSFVPQFFDPTTWDGDLIIQPVTWNAFPKELLVRFVVSG